MPISDYTPTVEQVAALIRARTKDSSGNEIGTFNANTRPTDVQVQELITQAVGTLATKVGADIPAVLFEEGERLAATRTAMLVELSYYPETIKTGHSNYEELKSLWIEGFGDGAKVHGTLVDAVTQALQEGGAEGPTEPGLPAYNFPPTSNIGTRPM